MTPSYVDVQIAAEARQLVSGSSELTLLRKKTATLLTMKENIRRLLEQTPEKPLRSKLEPHVDVIVTLRRKRRSYREIAEFFREHLAIAVAPSTIHDFVLVRRRGGKPSTLSIGEYPVHEPN